MVNHRCNDCGRTLDEVWRISIDELPRCFRCAKKKQNEEMNKVKT